MEISKLQTPRIRRKKEEVAAEARTLETVKQEEDGTVSITRVEIRPQSAGREKFGQGTKIWPKHPLDAAQLQQFSR